MEELKIEAEPEHTHVCEPPRPKRWHKNALWSCPYDGRVWVCRDSYEVWTWFRTNLVVTAGMWNITHSK